MGALVGEVVGHAVREEMEGAKGGEGFEGIVMMRRRRDILQCDRQEQDSDGCKGERGNGIYAWGGFKFV